MGSGEFESSLQRGQHTELQQVTIGELPAVKHSFKFCPRLYEFRIPWADLQSRVSLLHHKNLMLSSQPPSIYTWHLKAPDDYALAICLFAGRKRPLSWGQT
ncbi:hypothetical protein MJO28_008096 [Puccinia striiformis f. sp. tritici]|uniref:Uncharacterized protein n=1 Tax=Puccinia striiformis f. sp. tritici TaxID=168172 RepID=A0ACC0E9N4_9BASI|nr:hypothetical protein MJO28_008096 [Puccinia striiformis f. sp. tritici]